jgi:hypothetical protein
MTVGLGSIKNPTLEFADAIRRGPQVNHQDDPSLSSSSLESLRERVRRQGERVSDLRRAASSVQQAPARYGKAAPQRVPAEPPADKQAPR